jgi:hypothetical protein
LGELCIDGRILILTLNMKLLLMSLDALVAGTVKDAVPLHYGRRWRQ